jgi:hypothetical protein
MISLMDTVLAAHAKRAPHNEPNTTALMKITMNIFFMVTSYKTNDEIILKFSSINPQEFLWYFWEWWVARGVVPAAQA